MHLTATHINYFHICHRKLWLFANGILTKSYFCLHLNLINSIAK